MPSPGVNANEYAVMRQREEEYWWYRALHAQVRNVAQRKLEVLHDATVLDAGCGTGGLLSVLRHDRVNAILTGIDDSSEAISFARDRGLDVALARATIEALPFADHSFDLVISLDVLCNQGLNDSRALAEFQRVLKPLGSLVLNLPAFEFLKGAHDIAVHTGRRYTRPRLKKLLFRAGFAIERLTYWNMLLFTPIALWRYITRRHLGKRPARSDLYSLPHFVNSLLEKHICWEFRLGTRIRLPFGTSVFAVAGKRP